MPDTKNDIVKHDAYEPMTPLREVMNRLLEESMVGLGRIEPWFTGRAFPLDLLETEDAYMVEAALPGFKPEEIEVTALGDTLTIRAQHDERKEQRDEKHGKESVYLRRERSVGEFVRVIELPMTLDPKKVTAGYEHGLLTLRIAKTEREKPVVIPIKKRETVAALN
ncbi:MAG TPA: Hsp20/alpha crystallin family protein [Ktedonobacterales bacterium]